MGKYPQNTSDFHAWFPDDDACRAYLQRLRWPEGPRCPRCPRSPRPKILTMRPPYHRCTRCGCDFTVTSGTLLAGTRLPLKQEFELMWYVVHQPQGASALSLQRVLGLRSYKTAWRWLHRLRRAMAPSTAERLAGSIEADKAYVGCGSAGRALVLILAQADGIRMGRIRLVRLPGASSAALPAAIARYVEQGTRVLTDGCPGYAGLTARGYEHEVVREGASVGANLLPRTARVAAKLQKFLLQTYRRRVALSHLDFYLDEFTFRFNRRRARSRGQLFHQLIRQALTRKPLVYRPTARHQQPKRQRCS